MAAVYVTVFLRDMVFKRIALQGIPMKEAGKTEELMDMEFFTGLMEIVMRVVGKEDSSTGMPS
jgi:hypothetical protein